MALKINLKPGDRLLMSTSSVQVVGEGYTTLVIEGDIPVLRESDAIALEDAIRPSQKFRYLVQRAYLTADDALLPQARALCSQLQDQGERALAAIETFETGQHFKALREAIAIDEAMAR